MILKILTLLAIVSVTYMCGYNSGYNHAATYTSQIEQETCKKLIESTKVK